MYYQSLKFPLLLAQCYCSPAPTAVVLEGILQYILINRKAQPVIGPFLLLSLFSYLNFFSDFHQLTVPTKVTLASASVLSFSLSLFSRHLSSVHIWKCSVWFSHLPSCIYLNTNIMNFPVNMPILLQTTQLFLPQACQIGYAQLGASTLRKKMAQGSCHVRLLKSPDI